MARLKQVMAHNFEIFRAPQIIRQFGVRAAAAPEGKVIRDRINESGHRWNHHAESIEHALKSGEDALPADGMHAYDSCGRFTEPEVAALRGSHLLEKALQRAAPAVPIGAGAEDERIAVAKERKEIFCRASGRKQRKAIDGNARRKKARRKLEKFRSISGCTAAAAVYEKNRLFVHLLTTELSVRYGAD